MRPRIIAHRGGALLWPENSLLAVQEAARLPIDEVELDVHLSADGVPIVLHDATLERTTHGAGPVRAWSAAALGQVRLRGGVDAGCVPTLAAAAAVLASTGCGLRLEIKVDAAGWPYPGIVDACAAVLDANGMRTRTFMISFAPALVEAAVAAGGFAGAALLFGSRSWRGTGARLAATLARAAGVAEIGLPFADCASGEAVTALRDEGLRIGAWGVDDAVSLARARVLGLDAITTDDPVTACCGDAAPTLM